MVAVLLAPRFADATERRYMAWKHELLASSIASHRWTDIIILIVSTLIRIRSLAVGSHYYMALGMSCIYACLLTLHTSQLRNVYNRKWTAERHEHVQVALQVVLACLLLVEYPVQLHYSLTRIFNFSAMALFPVLNFLVSQVRLRSILLPWALEAVAFAIMSLLLAPAKSMVQLALRCMSWGMLFVVSCGFAFVLEMRQRKQFAKDEKLVQQLRVQMQGLLWVCELPDRNLLLAAGLAGLCLLPVNALGGSHPGDEPIPIEVLIMALSTWSFYEFVSTKPTDETPTHLHSKLNRQPSEQQQPMHHVFDDAQQSAFAASCSTLQQRRRTVPTSQPMVQASEAAFGRPHIVLANHSMTYSMPQCRIDGVSSRSPRSRASPVSSRMSTDLVQHLGNSIASEAHAVDTTSMGLRFLDDMACAMAARSRLCGSCAAPCCDAANALVQQHQLCSATASLLRKTQSWPQLHGCQLLHAHADMHAASTCSSMHSSSTDTCGQSMSLFGSESMDSEAASSPILYAVHDSAAHTAAVPPRQGVTAFQGASQLLQNVASSMLHVTSALEQGMPQQPQHSTDCTQYNSVAPAEVYDEGAVAARMTNALPAMPDMRDVSLEAEMVQRFLQDIRGSVESLGIHLHTLRAELDYVNGVPSRSWNMPSPSGSSNSNAEAANL